MTQHKVSFPKDIVIIILESSDSRTICKCRRVSKEWFNLCNYVLKQKTKIPVTINYSFRDGSTPFYETTTKSEFSLDISEYLINPDCSIIYKIDNNSTTLKVNKDNKIKRDVVIGITLDLGADIHCTFTRPGRTSINDKYIRVDIFLQEVFGDNENVCYEIKFSDFLISETLLFFKKGKKITPFANIINVSAEDCLREKCYSFFNKKDVDVDLAACVLIYLFDYHQLRDKKNKRLKNITSDEIENLINELVLYNRPYKFSNHKVSNISSSASSYMTKYKYHRENFYVSGSLGNWSQAEVQEKFEKKIEHDFNKFKVDIERYRNDYKHLNSSPSDQEKYICRYTPYKENEMCFLPKVLEYFEIKDKSKIPSRQIFTLDLNFANFKTSPFYLELISQISDCIQENRKTSEGTIRAVKNVLANLNQENYNEVKAMIQCHKYSEEVYHHQK